MIWASSAASRPALRRLRERGDLAGVALEDVGETPAVNVAGHAQDLGRSLVERVDPTLVVEGDDTGRDVGDDRSQAVLQVAEVGLGFPKLARPGRHPAFQVAAVLEDLVLRGRELLHHPVEGVGHRPELVPGMDGQPGLEVARGRPRDRLLHAAQGADHDPGDQQVQQKQESHERRAGQAVDQPAGEGLAPVQLRQGVEQVQPSKGLVGRGEPAGQGECFAPAESHLLERGLRPGDAPQSGERLGHETTLGEEGAATRPDEQSLSVGPHEKDEAGLGREGRRFLAQELADRAGICSGGKVDPLRFQPHPEQPRLRGQVGQVDGERIRVLAEQVVDEVALVAGPQGGEQALVLLDEACPLLAKERHEEHEEGRHHEGEHHGQGERDLGVQPKIAEEAPQTRHPSAPPPSRGRGPRGGRPAGTRPRAPRPRCGDRRRRRSGHGR